MFFSFQLLSFSSSDSSESNKREKKEQKESEWKGEQDKKGGKERTKMRKCGGI